MKTTILLAAVLLALLTACSSDDEAAPAASDAAEGSATTPTPWPTRVERENVVASHRGGDKGCEVFHELEEGIAAGAFADAGAGPRIRLMVIQMSLFVNNAEPLITETVDALLRATDRPTTLEGLEQPLADLANACADAGY